VTKGDGENLCLKCNTTRETASKEGKKGLFSKLLSDKQPSRPTPSRSTSARSSVVRKAGTGRKLEVHFRNDKIIKGTTYKLDPHSLGFYLVPVEPAGDQERIYIYFSDLKAIYSVREFGGKFDPMEGAEDQSAEGQEIKIAFEDGEILEGRTLHHFDPSCQRFFLVPKDTKGNKISVLVERSALKGIEMEGFKQGVFVEEEEMLGPAQIARKGRAPLSQNESMGDLYFSMKNYDSALTEYEKVQKEYPRDKRLALKISVCNFNRGVNFIKSRKYLEAKAEFEKIDEDDPIYEKAKRKMRKIDKILKEVESMGQ
jgi:tetratricopeptide (TPR) repeat protein